MEGTPFMPASPEIFSDITHLSGRFRGILLDAYGVFWGSDEFGLLPGAKEAMEKLVASGKIVGILSNSTQLALKEIRKLNRHGLEKGKHFHFLRTSGEVARSIFLNEKLPFATPSNHFFLFGGAHPRFSSHEAIFQDTRYTQTPDIDEADFIYIAVPHINGEDQENPELFQEEVQRIKLRNLPMVCPNPDQFAHEGNPPKAVVRQGSIARMYEKIGGQVFYIGKPYARAYEMAMDDFKHEGVTDSSDVLMVGDTPETDIRGARSLRVASALVTQTGIMADRIHGAGLESVLKDLSPCDYPDYFIGRL